MNPETISGQATGTAVQHRQLALQEIIQMKPGAKKGPSSRDSPCYLLTWILQACSRGARSIQSKG